MSAASVENAIEFDHASDVGARIVVGWCRTDRGRGVQTVVCDGQTVVEDGHMTTVDEESLDARAQIAGEAITARSGLPDRAKYSVY